MKSVYTLVDRKKRGEAMELPVQDAEGVSSAQQVVINMVLKLTWDSATNSKLSRTRSHCISWNIVQITGDS